MIQALTSRFGEVTAHHGDSVIEAGRPDSGPEVRQYE
jgi:hypothetical protein